MKRSIPVFVCLILATVAMVLGQEEKTPVPDGGKVLLGGVKRLSERAEGTTSVPDGGTVLLGGEVDPQAAAKQRALERAALETPGIYLAPKDPEAERLYDLEMLKDPEAERLYDLGTPGWRVYPLVGVARSRLSDQELRSAVTKEFTERQRLQRAELEKLRQRLESTEKLLDERERLRDQIIERRVQELLNPNLNWETKSEAKPWPVGTSSGPAADDPQRQSAPQRPSVKTAPASPGTDMRPGKPVMANPSSRLALEDAASAAAQLVLLIGKLKDLDQLTKEEQRIDTMLKETPIEFEQSDALVKQQESVRHQLDSVRRELSALRDRYDVAKPPAAAGSTAKRMLSLEELAPGNAVDSFLKANPAIIEKLKTRGHFAQSEDGTMWAWVIADPDMKGEAIIQLRKADGSLLETVEVPRTVGELRFTKEGLATIEADGSLKLRLPRRYNLPPQR